MGASFAFRMPAPAIDIGCLFHRLASCAAVFAFRYRATAHGVCAFLSFGRHLNLLSKTPFTAAEQSPALAPPLQSHLVRRSSCCSPDSPDLLRGAALQRFPLPPYGFRRPTDLGRDRSQCRTDGASHSYKRVVFRAASAPARFRVHSILRFGHLRVWFGPP